MVSPILIVDIISFAAVSFIVLNFAFRFWGPIIWITLKK
jgi:hypothetical protein